METVHRIFYESSARMGQIEDNSADLICTSPPYPMIQMWDETFSRIDESVRFALEKNDGPAAFESMHRLLAGTWNECSRILRPGGVLCINIGDATRSIDGEFRLYSNHAKIISIIENLGFRSLPCIIWQKTTNAPNKFLGSGMLPGGAYVTLEHEYILVFRKGSRRIYSDEEKGNRRRSGYFWEERNRWFSDSWNISGARQIVPATKGRNRSGAFPFELAIRLVLMHSSYGDLVVDPFAGTGTTASACIVAGRNSAMYEIDTALSSIIDTNVVRAADASDSYQRRRVAEHRDFVEERAKKRPVRYINRPHGFPVVTKQEIDLELLTVVEINKQKSNQYSCRLTPISVPSQESLW